MFGTCQHPVLEEHTFSQTFEQIPQGLVVHLHGELGPSTEDTLDMLFARLSARRDILLVFDLSKVTAFSSFAMSQFMVFRRRAVRQGTRFALIRLRPELEESVRQAGQGELLEGFGGLLTLATEFLKW